MASSGMRSAEIRRAVGHPIMDVDGHQAPVAPGYEEHLRELGGARFVDRCRGRLATHDPMMLAWYGLSFDQRSDRRAVRGGWWGQPARNTLDRATGALPGLLYERMDELGLDFTTLYAGGLFTQPYEEDEEVRRLASRAMNAFQAELYSEYIDRMTVVAVIPMHSPQEAIDELEHAVNVCGLKVIGIPPGVRRPIPELHRRVPEAYPEACWWDSYGLDSAYDYDPFWAKCVELQVAVTAHGGVVPGLPLHGRSVSNYMANHLGTHAYQQSLLCKSLFMGGVTRRFPTLNFAFLECGAGWACTLYADVVGHWEKRNKGVIDDLKPARVDRAHYTELLERYEGQRLSGKVHQVVQHLDAEPQPVDPEILDEWRLLDIADAEEIRDLFTKRFYFGCEADDPINAWAFASNLNPFGAQLRPVFSSDITHWDVPDITLVVEDAYELVEHGLITEEQFRDFVLTNPIRLHAGMNPDFFEGTTIEAAARTVLLQAERLIG